MHSSKLFFIPWLLLQLLMVGCTDTKKPKELSARKLNSTELKEYAASYAEGQQIFLKYCTTCHRPPEAHVTDNYTFDGIFERHSEQYFMNFITDSKRLKLSGDKYALTLDTVFNYDYEHLFKDSLSTQDLNNIILYFKVAVRQYPR